MTVTEQPTATQPVVRQRRVRDRIIPRSVLGLSVLILFTALGAAFSGAVLYSYYEYRIDKNEQAVTKLAGETQKTLKGASDIIKAETDAAKKEVRDELGPIKQLAASEETLTKLVQKVAPSVWFVHTTDEAGQSSVGSAFVVASDGEQSFLLASYNSVRAATRSPGPEVRVRKGDEDLKATVWTWQPERDLALLIVPKGNLPKLPWSTGKDAVKLGERVFAVSGLGSEGGGITQGFVSDVFSEGIQHTAPIGNVFRGGPLIDSNGEVLGVASADYGPLGFAPGAVTFAMPVDKSCERVLRCPGGEAGGAGQRGG